MKSVSTSPDDAGPAMERRLARSDLAIHRAVMAVLWTIVIMMLCWLPGHFVQKVESGSGWFKIVNLDKAIHSAIFIIFALLWARVGPLRAALPGSRLAESFLQQLPNSVS